MLLTNRASANIQMGGTWGHATWKSRDAAAVTRRGRLSAVPKCKGAKHHTHERAHKKKNRVNIRENRFCGDATWSRNAVVSLRCLSTHKRCAWVRAGRVWGTQHEKQKCCSSQPPRWLPHNAWVQGREGSEKKWRRCNFGCLRHYCRRIGIAKFHPRWRQRKRGLNSASTCSAVYILSKEILSNIFMKWNCRYFIQ